MWYLGGKHRQSKAIVAAVRDLYPDFAHYVEPFCGALGSASAMAAQFPDRHFILSDANPYLMRFWSAAILEGWDPPEKVTLADWAWYKEHRPLDDPMTGYVGFAWAWLGNFFSTPAMDKKYDPPRFHGSYGGCMRKIEILRRANVDMRCCDYQQACVPADSMVYLDPPYHGRTKQSKDNADLDLREYKRYADSIAGRAGVVVIATEFENHHGWEVIHNWGNTIAPRGSRKDKPADPTEELLMLVLPNGDGGAGNEEESMAKQKPAAAKSAKSAAPKKATAAPATAPTARADTRPRQQALPLAPAPSASTKPAARPQPAPAPARRPAPAGKGNGKADPGDDVARQARPLEQFPELEDVLPDLCSEYRRIAVEMKRLEDRRKELSAEIMPLLEAVECDSIQGDGWVAMRVIGSRSTLSRERLLEAGVAMATIEACTTKVTYPYLQVRAAAEE